MPKFQGILRPGTDIKTILTTGYNAFKRINIALEGIQELYQLLF
jgi:hypothetical protein